jgi:hypothetical protein
VVAALDGRSHFPDRLKGFGLLKIRAGYLHIIIEQYTGDSAHHGASDTDHMNFFTFIFAKIE